MLSKNEIRQSVIADLSALPRQDRMHWQEELTGQLLDHIKNHKVKRLGFYYSFSPEFETRELIHLLTQAGIEVYLPQTLPGYAMAFARFEGEENLLQVKKKLYEPNAACERIDPKQLDLMVVPGVAFQSDGHRIGFGAGYYDRFLEKYPNLATMSLVFPTQLFAAGTWSSDRFDYPIDTLLTLPSYKERTFS